jgi:hypothetical protein
MKINTLEISHLRHRSPGVVKPCDCYTNRLQRRTQSLLRQRFSFLDPLPQPLRGVAWVHRNNACWSSHSVPAKRRQLHSSRKYIWFWFLSEQRIFNLAEK